MDVHVWTGSTCVFTVQTHKSTGTFYTGNFVNLTLSVSFGRDARSLEPVGPLVISGVYARGSKRSHTGGKCVTCSGLVEWWSVSKMYCLYL